MLDRNSRSVLWARGRRDQMGRGRPVGEGNRGSGGARGAPHELEAREVALRQIGCALCGDAEAETRGVEGKGWVPVGRRHDAREPKPAPRARTVRSRRGRARVGASRRWWAAAHSLALTLTLRMYSYGSAHSDAEGRKIGASAHAAACSDICCLREARGRPWSERCSG